MKPPLKVNIPSLSWVKLRGVWQSKQSAQSTIHFGRLIAPGILAEVMHITHKSVKMCLHLTLGSDSESSPEKRVRLGEASCSEGSPRVPKQKNRRRCHSCQTKLELVQQELGSCRCGQYHSHLFLKSTTWVMWRNKTVMLRGLRVYLQWSIVVQSRCIAQDQTDSLDFFLLHYQTFLLEWHSYSGVFCVGYSLTCLFLQRLQFRQELWDPYRTRKRGYLTPLGHLNFRCLL